MAGIVRRRLQAKSIIYLGCYPDFLRGYPSGFVEVFREGVRSTARDRENFGTGEGERFQALSKSSPAFAAEFAAIGLRNVRTHWGPINRRAAEVRPECLALLQQVEDAVDAANLCPLLW